MSLMNILKKTTATTERKGYRKFQNQLKRTTTRDNVQMLVGKQRESSEQN